MMTTTSGILMQVISLQDVVIMDEVSIKDLSIFRKYGYAAERLIHLDRKSDAKATMFIVAASSTRILPGTMAVPAPTTIIGAWFTTATWPMYKQRILVQYVHSQSST